MAQDAGQEALVSHLRDIVSVDSSGNHFQRVYEMHILTYHRLEAIQFSIHTS